MMICGVLLLRRAARARARCGGDRASASSCSRVFASARSQTAGWRVLGDDPRSTSRARRSRRRCRRRAGERELQAFVSRLAGDAARPARGRCGSSTSSTTTRRQRADRAHPPLLRRRHRARARDAVDDGRDAPTVRRRCRSTPRAAQRRAQRDDRACGSCSAPLSGALESGAQDRRDADRKGRRRLERSREGGRARRARAARSPPRSRSSR